MAQIYSDMQTPHDIFFKPKPKKKNKKKRILNIKRTKAKFGEEVGNNILFVHALLGCDTTYRLYGIGKAVALKKFISDKHFTTAAAVFNQSVADTSQDDTVNAEPTACNCLCWVVAVNPPAQLVTVFAG